MRWLCLLVIAAGCGRQLSSEYCAANPHDPDCINAGLALVDAPAPCSSDMQCADQASSPVCDVPRHECVACTPSDQNVCTSSGLHCGDDDACHQCLVDGDCNGGVCLPDQTCASTGSVLYASPDGGGDCFSATGACNLATAIGKLDAAHGVIFLAPGNYPEGPLTIGVSGVLIGKGANNDPSLTTITNASGGSGAVLTINNNAAVALDYVSTYGSDKEGIFCTTATLTMFRSNSYNNAWFGVATGGCNFAMEQARLYGNTYAALSINDSKVNILNNFMYENGNVNEQQGGAVRLKGSTSGEVAFNTVAFNTYKSNQHPGVTCSTTGFTKVEFNIVAGNIGKAGQDDPTSSACLIIGTTNYVNDTADDVKFKSATDPLDLHLTANSPNQSTGGGGGPGGGFGPPGSGDQGSNNPAIRDNNLATCVSYDIDGQKRPINGSCDLGADEYGP